MGSLQQSRTPPHAPAQLRLAWAARRELLKEIDPKDWRVGPLHRAAFAWQSMWFSINDTLQEKAYAEQLEQVDLAQAPIFVLGFWRSGTTFLHELICCDKRFGYPTTLQCMNPSTMLLAKPPGTRKDAMVERPMDGMPISSDSPQEDEFALLALGLPSAYQLLLTPQNIEGALRTLDPQIWSAEERDRWMQGFARFVRRLRLKDERTLVFKSPTHVFRVPLLRQLWPNARFITIIRDPLEVWHSNMRLWQVLCEQYALTTWKLNDIERFVAQAYRCFTTKLTEARQELAGDAYTEVAFDALAHDPIGELEKIYTALDIEPDEETRTGWREYLRHRAQHRPREYPVSAQERQRIVALMGLKA